MPVLVVIIALAAAALLGHLAAAGAQYALMLFLGSLMVAILAFFSPRLSLALLVFSMLLSPEIGFGAVDPSRSLVVRYDDILLVVIFLSWFARTAVLKNKPFITATPVQTPILLYTALCVVSTSLGVMRGDIEWRASMLYVLKYIEYFLLYFMTVNIVDSEEDASRYMRYGLVVAMLVTIYAYYYYYSVGIDARATAPFEAPLNNPQESEPASLGGYYLLVFGILMSFLVEGGVRASLFSVVLLLFMFPAFLFTFSRASYIGMSAMLPALFFFTRRRRLLVLGFFAAVAIGFVLMPQLSQKVLNRITMTYTGAYATQSFQTGIAGTIKLEDSAASRVYSLRRVVIEKLPKHPVFGWGVTGIGMGDTQYALVLGELGILGAIFFIWMIIRLFHTAKAVFAYYDDPVVKALSMGFMISLTGFLFQALGVNTFIIVRIMEPFWFIAALLSALYVKKTAPCRRGK